MNADSGVLPLRLLILCVLFLVLHKNMPLTRPPPQDTETNAGRCFLVFFCNFEYLSRRFVKHQIKALGRRLDAGGSIVLTKIFLTIS